MVQWQRRRLKNGITAVNAYMHMITMRKIQRESFSFVGALSSVQAGFLILIAVMISSKNRRNRTEFKIRVRKITGVTQKVKVK